MRPIVNSGSQRAGVLVQGWSTAPKIGGFSKQAVGKDASQALPFVAYSRLPNLLFRVFRDTQRIPCRERASLSLKPTNFSRRKICCRRVRPFLKSDLFCFERFSINIHRSPFSFSRAAYTNAESDGLACTASTKSTLKRANERGGPSLSMNPLRRDRRPSMPFDHTWTLTTPRPRRTLNPRRLRRVDAGHCQTLLRSGKRTSFQTVNSAERARPYPMSEHTLLRCSAKKMLRDLTVREQARRGRNVRRRLRRSKIGKSSFSRCRNFSNAPVHFTVFAD